MPLYYPSHDALRLADRLVEEIGKRTSAYFQGRIGVSWYWHVPGGIAVTMHLDYTITEERWDVLRAEASTTRAGVFSSADFPFAVYATSATTPPFIHDLQGVAEWSNRLYFQMGHLIDHVVCWLNLLHAIAIAPEINPAAALPRLTALEAELVHFAQSELDGRFSIKDLHSAFAARISRSRLGKVARAWEADGLLTERPRRVTYALQALAEESLAPIGPWTAEASVQAPTKNPELPTASGAETENPQI